MKIYTGTGDRGTTSLFSGERIPKSDNRIEAYGTVDEVNSFIGAIAATLPSVPESETIGKQLLRIQSDLFRVGAWLATSEESPALSRLQPMENDDSRWLEEEMDRIQENIPELRAFILPGGHPSAAWAHVARTVCRRSERRIITLLEAEKRGWKEIDGLLMYMNRLSDYFFVLARYCNYLAGVEDKSFTTGME